MNPDKFKRYLGICLLLIFLLFALLTGDLIMSLAYFIVYIGCAVLIFGKVTFEGSNKAQNTRIIYGENSEKT